MSDDKLIWRDERDSDVGTPPQPQAAKFVTRDKTMCTACILCCGAPQPCKKRPLKQPLLLPLFCVVMHDRLDVGTTRHVLGYLPMKLPTHAMYLLTAAVYACALSCRLPKTSATRCCRASHTAKNRQSTEHHHAVTNTRLSPARPVQGQVPWRARPEPPRHSPAQRCR